MSSPVDNTAEEQDTHLQPSARSWYLTNGMILAVCALAGFIAAMALSIEAYQLAGGEQSSFICDLSANVSCSAVAQTWQAELLGFPNAYVGIAFEAVALAIAVAVIGGTHFPRWYYWGLELLFTGGLFFAIWLFYQSYFVIQILCPWCLLTFFTTVLMWAVMTRVNIRESAFGTDNALQRFVAAGSDWVVTILVLVALLALVIVKYGPGLTG